MGKQTRKILALLLSCTMVVTSMTFVGSNNLKAADEEAANQVEQTTDQTSSEPEAETPPVADPVTTEETMDVSTTDESSDATAGEGEASAGEEEVVEEEVKKPAQVLTATASDGAKITVNAKEGALPEGSSVKVKVVSAKSVENAVEAAAGEVGSLAAYDITIHDADGKEIQPDGAVSVQIKNADVDGDADAVYHVNDAKTSAEAVNASTSGDDASFKASHFSIYVVVVEGGAETPALATYEFYDVDGETVIDTQILKDGEMLVAPAAPEVEGQIFQGWFSEGTKVTFGAKEVKTTSTIKVYPNFGGEVRYVFFLNDKGSVLETKEAVPGDVVSTDDVLFTSGENKSLIGWYDNKECEGNPITSVTVGDSDITLYPKVETGYTITYVPQGGSYVPHAFVGAGEVTVAPTAPTRPGYTFAGWSLTEDGTNYTFGNTIEENITLYAKWTAGTAQYTVIYWIENPNYDNQYLEEAYRDKEQYSFIKSETKTGAVGAATEAKANLTSKDFENAGWNKEGFTAQQIEQREIAGDGSTIVNVKYDRKYYTLSFEGSVKCGKEEHEHYGGFIFPGLSWNRGETNGCFTSKNVDGEWTNVLTCTKEEHEHDDSCIVGTIVKAKYGASVVNAWPKNEYGLTGWYAESGAIQSSIDVMPMENQEFEKQESHKTTETAYYYVEVVPGETASNTVTYKGKTYKLHHSDTSGGSGYSVSDEDEYAMTGYTFYRCDSSAYDGARFFYDRNTYTITLVNKGTTTTIKDKYFEQDLSDMDSLDSVKNPERPAGVDSNYVFAGWTLDENTTGELYSFSGRKMPARNITLYAKWVAPNCTLSVYKTTEGSDSPTTRAIEYGSYISEGSIPTPTEKEGYDFIGWATKNSAGKLSLYNFKTQVRGDVKLYPYYVSISEYKVEYDLNGGTGNVPTDDKEYTSGSYAKVFSGLGLKKDGKTFQGWKASTDEKVYQAGSKVKVTSPVVTMTAQWADEATKTSVVYKAGEGNGTNVTDNNVRNNNVITIKSADACGFSKENCEFTGWAYTDKNGVAKTAKAGDELRIDTIGSNEFIAQWKKIKFDIESIDEIADVTYNGQEQKQTVVVRDKDGNKLTAGTEYTVSYSSDVTNVGTVTVTVKGIGNYSGELTATYNIKKAAVEVTVSGKSASKKYTGVEQSVSGYEVGEKPEGVSISLKSGVKAEAKGTDADTYTMGLTADSFDVESANYAVTLKVTDGKLTIAKKKIEVKVSGKSESVVYDGSTHKVSGYTSNAPAGVTVSLKSGKTAEASGSKAGTYTMGLKAEDFEVSAANYEVNLTVEDGKITIRPASINPEDEDADESIKVSSPEGTTYNGKSQKQEVTVSKGLLGKELTKDTDYTVTYSDDTTNAGEVTVTVEGKGNYSGNITKKYTIAKAELTVTTESASRAYNGEKLTAGGKLEGLVNGETATLKTTGAQTEVGNSKNTYEIEWTGTAKSGNYEVKPKTIGDLEVTQATGTGKVEIENWEYGKNPSKPVITAPEGYDEEPTIKYYKKDKDGKWQEVEEPTKNTDAGEYKIEVTWPGDNNHKQVTAEDEFKIKKRSGNGSVTIEGWTYGDEPNAPEITTPDGYSTPSTKYQKKVGEDQWEDVEGTPTEAGDYRVVVTWPGDKNHDSITARAEFTIAAAEVIVTPAKAAKVYGSKDPDPLTTVTITDKNGKTFTNKNVVKYGIARADGEAVGEYDLWVYGSSKDVKGSETQSNYTATFGTSKFYVVKSSIEDDPTLPDEPDPEHPEKPVYDGITVDKIDNPTYDGEEHKIVPVIRDKDGKEIDINNFEITYPGDDYTNAGEKTIIIKAKDGSGYGGEITITFRIKKRNVVLTSASASKPYDGTPLVKEEITVSGAGFIKGEGFIYKFSGTQTEVGSSDNEFEYVVNEEYTFTNPDNYSISTVFGTLTVEEAAIIVEPVDDDEDPVEVEEATVGHVIRKIEGKPLEIIGDPDVPLSNFFEDCCILHFIILFMAIVLLILYIIEDKRRKERIRNLEEELAKNGVMYW